MKRLEKDQAQGDSVNKLRAREIEIPGPRSENSLQTKIPR